MRGEKKGGGREGLDDILGEGRMGGWVMGGEERIGEGGLGREGGRGEDEADE